MKVRSTLPGLLLPLFALLGLVLVGCSHTPPATSEAEGTLFQCSYVKKGEWVDETCFGGRHEDLDTAKRQAKETCSNKKDFEVADCFEAILDQNGHHYVLIAIP